MFFKPEYLKDAQERQRLLKKVYFYRRNQLAPAERKALSDLAERFEQAIVGRLKPKVKNKQEAQEAQKLQLQKLEAESDKLLKRLGGHYFKHYHIFENVETFVVAAILAIGIRSFFLQPFKIPTNSMWPTYHGMTYTIRENNIVTPLQSFSAFVFQGATQHRVIAPVAGPVSIAAFNADEREDAHAAFRYQAITKRFLGLIPSQAHRYTFYVGQQPVTLDVPAEFNIDKLLGEKFFSRGQRFVVDNQGRVSTGVNAKAGETFLDFQIETGDMLFVDRFTYNFTPPKVGDPIVFRTRAIPGITALYAGIPDDKYYIKRLVGLPGDTLSITGSTLYRNSHPITGSSIFAKNFNKTFPYHGYQAGYDLADGQAVTVPEGDYYAFGDNSPESLDSRVWGGLPRDQVVGRAVFIYYPFTSRWGFSK